MIDLKRTSVIFTDEGLDPPCAIPAETGNNPIYNMLVAYAEFDATVSYTQGMNFLAALLYTAVGDEMIAFAMMAKIMFELNWRDVYAKDLIHLISLTKKINTKLKKDSK